MKRAISAVGRDIADEAWLLCFDEFQVTDISDAVIMHKLFQSIWREGTVVVATSNRAPEDLYEGGLNRRDFLPFIDVLRSRCMPCDIGASNDFRLLSQPRQNLFAVGRREQGEIVSAEAQWKELLGVEERARTIETVIPVAFGRTMRIPAGNVSLDGHAAFFEFDDLCGKDLGAADFRAVADAFDAVILAGIPVLSPKEHDRARRFITLIDQLYESKVRLCCVAAAAPPHELFVGGLKSRDKELASIRELRFAFRRCASRLVEMTAGYPGGESLNLSRDAS